MAGSPGAGKLALNTLRRAKTKEATVASAIEQLIVDSQEQHRRYYELFGQAPIDGQGWDQLSGRIRAISAHVEDTRRRVLALDFSTAVSSTFGESTRSDHVTFDDTATTTDTAARVTDSSARVNVEGANAIAANARAEAAEIAAVPDPQSPAGQATILAIIAKYQAKSATTVTQSAAAEHTLAQRAASGAGSPAPNDSHIQLVDHTFRESPIPSPLPDPDAGSGDPPLPVSDLGLPRYDGGSLSPVEARTVYAHGELRMRQLNDRLIAEGLTPEQRAKIMFEQRNALRSWTRALMSDRDLAEQVTAQNPNLTWEDLIARNQSKGLQGDDLYNAIIDSSTHSRPSVNDALGVDPENPPPLPASGSGGLTQAPLGSDAPQPPVEERVGAPLETGNASPSTGGGGGGGGSWGDEQTWADHLSMSREELIKLAESGDPLGNIAKMILQSPEYQARHPPPPA